MSNKLNTKVTHAGSNKQPILSVGTVFPEVLCQFENTCRSFFCNKEGLEPKDFVAHIVGSLHNPLISNWYWTGQVAFDTLLFEDFMKEVCNKWLANDWEQDICQKVLGMKQAGMFWEWAVKM
jgi:hypothetical protein